MTYREVQNIAKQTMGYARKHIKAGINLLDIRRLCEEKLLELGADSFWYWDVGAFVFAGEETTQSVSGVGYVTSDRIIQPEDLITIDLSPQCNHIWGDYARTIVVRDGVAVTDDAVTNPEWQRGLQMEDLLHAELIRFATVQTTFEDLYYHMNNVIQQHEFMNLDFLGNLGHSIVQRKKDRIYIEKGNRIRLKDVDYFTFEPHICAKNAKYGFKKENIYYFENEALAEL